MEGLARRYLKVAPLAFLPLAALYHLVDFRAGLAAAVVHLSLAFFGIRSRANAAPFSAARLPAVLLTAGGALVWAAGPAGPPDPRDVGVTTFNNTGLTIGFLLIVLGFIATETDAPSTQDDGVARIGHTLLLLGFLAWLVESGMGQAMYRSPYALTPVAEAPDWYATFSGLRTLVTKVVEGPIYLGEALLVYALARSGLIERRRAIAMAGSTLAQVPLSTLLFIPFGIPALMALVPYYVGLSLLSGRALRLGEGKADLVREGSFSSS